MDPRTYLDTHGDDGAKALVEAVIAAGGQCTVGYFKQIAYGYRRPSPELAEIMVASDPKQQLDFISLLKARKKKDAAAPSDGEGGHAPQ